MKAIKIDVIKKEVYEVDYKGTDGIYKQLDCTCFCLVPKKLPGGDTILVDDEGIYRRPQIGEFIVSGYHDELSGHGIVVGNTRSGNSRDCQSSVEEIKRLIRFV